MTHEFSHFTLRVTQFFVPVVFMNNPACPLCIFHFPLPFTRLQLLKVLFQQFFNCLSDLAHPRHCSFPLLRLFRVDAHSRICFATVRQLVSRL